METRYKRHFNGRIQEVATYSKGRRHGTTSWFYANGFLERVAEFWYDQLHGTYYEFWPNGKRALKAEYIYSALESMEEYDESGNLIPEKSESITRPLGHHTRQNDCSHHRTNTPNSRTSSHEGDSLWWSGEYNGSRDSANDDGAR